MTTPTMTVEEQIQKLDRYIDTVKLFPQSPHPSIPTLDEWCAVRHSLRVLRDAPHAFNCDMGSCSICASAFEGGDYHKSSAEPCNTDAVCNCYRSKLGGTDG